MLLMQMTCSLKTFNELYQQQEVAVMLLCLRLTPQAQKIVAL